MKNLKKAFVLAGLAAAMLLILILYSNTRLTEKSKGVENPEARIRLLLQAGRDYSFNDLTEYELGKAYFDLGLQSLGRGQDEVRNFQEAIRSFRRSLRLNPCSPFSHFHLAQSLFYGGMTSLIENGDPVEEYRKSAELAGQNSQIFFEVGKILLSRWKDLNDKGRDFSATILRTLLNKKDPDELLTLMTIWDMNVQDYDVMEKILPEDPYALKTYAKFLGEKSRSLERRQQALSRAEFLEFKEAKAEYAAGENAQFYYQTAEASEYFKTCLETLWNIKFYQDVVHRSLIDSEEFSSVRKSALLNLIKSRVEQGASLKDVKEFLDGYLELEKVPSAVGELESYLGEKGLLFQNPEDHLDELEALEYQMRMYFKQSRYGEIIRIGRAFMQKILLLPPEKKDIYVRILCLIGDAQQKVDYLYDAGDFYQKALDLDPENLETLMRMRKNYEHLSNDQKINEIQAMILKLVSTGIVSSGPARIPKGSDSLQYLYFDGRDININLVFEEAQVDPYPLITIFFNNRVVWDGYLRGGILSLPLKTRIGRNQINTLAINRQVNLVRFEIN